MLKTDIIYTYLKQKGATAFNDLWKVVKKDYLKQYSEIDDENVLKNELYISLLSRTNLFVVNENKLWDLKENYTINEIEENNQAIFSDSLDSVSVDFEEPDVEDVNETEMFEAGDNEDEIEEKNQEEL